MDRDIFTREVLIDVSVNLIPISILSAFVLLFVAVAPWGIGLTLATGLQLALLVLPLVGVVILTYVAATRIESGRSDAE